MISDVERVRAADDDELDRLLGEAEAADSFGGSLMSREELVRLGRSHFETLLPELRRSVCGNDVLRTLLHERHEDRNTLVIAIATAVFGLSAAPLALAERVLRYGYGNLCPSGNGAP